MKRPRGDLISDPRRNCVGLNKALDKQCATHVAQLAGAAAMYAPRRAYSFSTCAMLAVMWQLAAYDSAVAEPAERVRQLQAWRPG